MAFDEDAIFETDESDTETIACPSCGQPVYEDADRCPQCGDWIVTSSSGAKVPRWARIVALILIVLFAGGLGRLLSFW